MSATRDITYLLRAWRAGDEDAQTELMPRVYRELRRIAGYLLSGESGEQVLETVDLVNEAYLRLVDLDSIDWQSRVHFYAMCARFMRRVLVDHARRLGRDKRGGGALRVDTAELRQLPDGPVPDIVAVHEALNELKQHDAQMASIVELRFFGGLDREGIAEVLGISSATVSRRWRDARAWLILYLRKEDPTD